MAILLSIFTFIHERMSMFIYQYNSIICRLSMVMHFTCCNRPCRSGIGKYHGLFVSLNSNCHFLQCKLEDARLSTVVMSSFGNAVIAGFSSPPADKLSIMRGTQNYFVIFSTFNMLQLAL